MEKTKETIIKLLELRLLTENEFTKRMVEDISCTEDKYLTFEAKAFSFWVLTIALPNEKKDFFDLLHDTYFQSIGFTQEQINQIYEELARRYERYTNAHNYFIKNKGNDAIGEVVITIVKNKNLEFSSYEDLVQKTISEEIPKINPFDVAQAFAIFAHLLKVNIETIGEIKKNLI